jgi:aerobic-type carbon monoxide dehydrogenase small subunit (CoxS/CutS family)
MRLVLNGEPVELEARADETLLTVLRRAGVLSVRETCGIGVCGACTVLVDGASMSGCLLLAGAVEGRAVTTAEGLGGDDPVQRAFGTAHGFQCGYCTPGMVLAAKELLAETPAPTDADIRAALSGNLCRCGSYVKIVQAVHLAAKEVGNG